MKSTDSAILVISSPGSRAGSAPCTPTLETRLAMLFSRCPCPSVSPYLRLRRPSSVKLFILSIQPDSTCSDSSIALFPKALAPRTILLFGTCPYPYLDPVHVFSVHLLYYRPNDSRPHHSSQIHVHTHLKNGNDS